ncbi:MAG: helix-turn-helix domain-containing protein [Atopostipes suicloacalis]|nr:helix-turn-helix domain-containing protein [Atopostipes suicloacalis]
MNEDNNKVYNRTGERLFTIANADLLLNKDLTVNDKMIYLYLKLYGGQNRLAFTGLERMSEEISLSVNTIKKSLRNLEDKKYIKITKQKQKHGYFLNNYHIFDPYNKNQYCDADKKFDEVENKRNDKTKLKNDEIDKEFEEWWEIYNKKKDKKAALTKFKTVRKKFDFETVMNGTKDYLKTISDKQYQKHPKTFLNNESFNNDYTEDYNIKSENIKKLKENSDNWIDEMLGGI